MTTTCQKFCGCQEYLEIEPIEAKVYGCFFLMLAVNMIALKTGTQWFIYKDYYPLKEKSPILCINMIAFFTLVVLLYPLLYVYNYFTQGFDRTEYVYRMFYYGLQGTLYFIYVLRSLRLVYAHTTDPSRQKTQIFKFFTYQSLLGAFCVGLVGLQMLPIIFNPDFQDYRFLTLIEFNTPFMRQIQIPFMIRTLCIQFLWILVLLYCLYLQALTHPKHSMKNQLTVVIATRIVFNIIDLVLVASQIGSASLFFGLCNKLQVYPSIQITKTLSIIVMFCYTAVYPLAKKKVYHRLLPAGRNYGLTKTMRDFLLEPEFLQIFSNFVEYLDEKEGTEKYTILLQKWKKVMILKFCQDKDEEEKLAQIKQLLQQNSIERIFGRENKKPQSQNSLVKSLLKSIESLEQQVNLSEDIMTRYRSDVNQKVQELERRLLEQLDRVYKEKYHQTKSYYHLKTKLDWYKKVNVNMILMKMALMVETDDSY